MMESKNDQQALTWRVEQLERALLEAQFKLTEDKKPAAVLEAVEKVSPGVGRPQKAEDSLRFRTTLIRFTNEEWNALQSLMALPQVKGKYRSKNRFLVTAVTDLIKAELVLEGLPVPSLEYDKP